VERFAIIADHIQPAALRWSFRAEGAHDNMTARLNCIDDGLYVLVTLIGVDQGTEDGAKVA
jgi:hypothetical protein